MAEPVASVFPGVLDSATTLFGDPLNLKQFTLDAGINASVQTISVAESIAAVNFPCYILIDSEIIYVETSAAGDFASCGRGAGGTTAATHTNGTAVYLSYAANMFSQLKRAIIATQTELGTDPAGTVTDVKTRLAQSLSGTGNLDFATSSELTIATGSITPTQNWHTVDTQADAGSDELDTIVATGLTDGFVLFIRANNDARSVVVKHNTGNILCATATDITLDDQRDICVLIYDSTLSKWLAGTFSIAGGSGIVSGPQAFGDNYKFSVTVASNNITVALKTVAGADPSAGDPVVIRIGDTKRTISAALSVTKNAGTNWFNAGSSELATQEIDYFIYLGYNATDGVVIGFSRYPFAHQYSDFSSTSTNEKYAAISTITNAAAGDYYENIGRFAATLSAGAGYTWTVPTFTAINLISRPMYDTRSLTWVPTVTSGTGAPTTVGKTAAYMFSGHRFFAEGHMLVTDKGTANGAMKLTPPFTMPDAVGFGQEVAVTGVGAAVVAISNLLYITKYDATSPWTNTWDWYFKFQCPV